ncbi:MAG: hypothetical protein HQ472_04420 [Ignavibacteria bacterium]|nr:hypothetical protein [Ignavibacteria bacterium]
MKMFKTLMVDQHSTTPHANRGWFLIEVGAIRSGHYYNLWHIAWKNTFVPADRRYFSTATYRAEETQTVVFQPPTRRKQNLTWCVRRDCLCKEVDRLLECEP